MLEIPRATATGMPLIDPQLNLRVEHGKQLLETTGSARMNQPFSHRDS